MTENKTKEQIKENNVYVLDLYRKGAELSKTTQEQSWFPPRGVFDREKGRMVAASANENKGEPGVMFPIDKPKTYQDWKPTTNKIESGSITKEMLEASFEELRQETFGSPPPKKTNKPFLRLVKNED